MAAEISGFDIYAPFFRVELAGKPFPPRERIISVDMDYSLGEPGMFKISLNEELDMDTQKFKFLDDEKIKPGTDVVIHYGYVEPKKTALFRGKIKAISPGFLATGIPSLGIEGYDLSFGLQKTQKKFKNNNVTYSMVVEDIAQKNDLSPDGIKSTKITHSKVERKKDEFDYVLIKRLAEDVAYEFFVRDKTLFFREPEDNKESNVTFEFRKNFISFSPRMTTATLVNEVKVTAWDHTKKTAISETAKISDIKNKVGIKNFDSIVEQSQGNKINIKMEGRVVRSNEEAKTLAMAELKRRNNGFIEGSLECAGDPELIPGMTININKVGKLFSGVYYITKAKHAIGDSGYKTTLDVRRSVL